MILEEPTLVLKVTVFVEDGAPRLRGYWVVVFSEELAAWRSG